MKIQLILANFDVYNIITMNTSFFCTNLNSTSILPAWATKKINKFTLESNSKLILTRMMERLFLTILGLGQKWYVQ
jgi:hypothetical protein